MAQVDIPLFYDTDRRAFTTGAGDVATVTKIQLGQLSTVDIILAIVKDDVAIELTTPSWVLGIKQINDQSGDYLIQSTTATKTGTGTSTRYTFTFDFDSTELRAFFDTYDPTEDYLALEIRDTVNGIVTLPALIIDPLPAYTVEGTTPTDAGGTLIVASGKTATISNTITLTGTDGATYDLDEFGDIPAVRYTNNQGLNSTQKGHARENIDVPSTTDLADTLVEAKDYTDSKRSNLAILGTPNAYRYATGLLGEWYFNEARGTTVNDTSGNAKHIDLSATTSNVYAWTKVGLQLNNGSADVPSLTNARTVALLYRVPRNADGFILCGGQGNGYGMFWSSYTATYTYHTAWGHGIAPLWWGGSSAGPRVNAGGWCLLFMELDQARTSQFSFGGRFSSTANRMSQIELAFASAWSGQLTSTIRERVYKQARAVLVSRGEYLDARDCPRRALLVPQWGQSNAEGRALLSEVSAPQLATDTSSSFINTWAAVPFQQMVVGTNHTYTTPATYFGPSAALAWEHAASDNSGQPLFISQTGAGSTYLANTGGTDWSTDESAATSWLGTALKTTFAAMAEMINAGIGPVTNPFWLQGESDATNVTYGNAYAANILALDTRVKEQLAINSIIYGRIRDQDPLANPTAVAAVRAALVSIGTTGSNQWIDLDTCSLDSGDVHYDADGMILLGQKLYEKLPLL